LQDLALDLRLPTPVTLVYLGDGWQSLPTNARGRSWSQMPDEILTLPEVAELLKVAEKTVYTMAQKREIPAFKVRGQWRFKREDIDRWIEERKAASRNDDGKSGHES